MKLLGGKTGGRIPVKDPRNTSDSARTHRSMPVLLRHSRHITSSFHIKCLSVGQRAHTGMGEGRVLTKITESNDNTQGNFSIESTTVAGNKAAKSKATRHQANSRSRAGVG